MRMMIEKEEKRILLESPKEQYLLMFVTFRESFVANGSRHPQKDGDVVSQHTIGNTSCILSHIQPDTQKDDG